MSYPPCLENFAISHDIDITGSWQNIRILHVFEVGYTFLAQHFLPISTKLILLVIFSLYKTKWVDLWVRQKSDQQVLQNTGCNEHYETLSLSMTSQNITK